MTAVMTRADLDRFRREHPEREVWEAQPKQKAFLQAQEFEVLYGGAAGGGKTDALLVHGFKVCKEHPRAQVMFLRRTFPDLNVAGGAIPRSQALFRKHGVWNGQEHRWTFANGSVLQFGHLEHANAHLNYRGAQFDCLLWDELTQFSEEQYLFLRSRVRATVDGMNPTVRAATNPGDVGHGWVKKRWIDAAPWGEPFVVGTNPVTGEEILARFIPAKVDDNQRLLERDPGYKGRLYDLPDHLRRAYLGGDWDIYEGQYFAEWRRELHVVDPFPIPKEWVRWVAVDYGFADPFCALWFAREPDTRRVYVYRELYGKGLRDEQQAALVAEKSVGETIYQRVGDPSMFNERREQEKPSIARVYQQAGVYLTPAQNSRVIGWQTIRRWLAHDPEKKPRLQVFGDCVNLIRTLPEMVHDPIDPEDLADKVRGRKTEDHAVDCLRYGAMAEEAAVPTRPPEPVTFGSPPKQTHAPLIPTLADRLKAQGVL